MLTNVLSRLRPVVLVARNHRTVSVMNTDRTQSLKAEMVSLKRQRILEAARFLFSRDGYEGTTVDAIAERLQVTKAFIYGYYENKGEILFEIAKRSAEQLLAATEEASRQSNIPHIRMRILIEKMCEIIIDNKDAVKIYLFESHHLADAQFVILDKEIRDRASRNITQFIEDGARSNDFVISDASLTRLALTGLISSIYSWYVEGGRLTRMGIIGFMTQAALRLIGDRRACAAMSLTAAESKKRLKRNH
jgi:AcrR family transcriptional regulator